MPKKLLVYYLLLIFVVGIGIRGFTQINAPTGTWLTEEHGLPFRQVNQLMVDSIGYIWMAGASKLARFDGKQYKLYTNQPESSPQLSFRETNSMIQTTDDRIWLLGGRQINVLNPHTDSIVYRLGNTQYQIQNMFWLNESLWLQSTDNQNAYLLKQKEQFNFDTVHIFKDNAYTFQVTLDTAETTLYYMDNHFRLMSIDLESKQLSILDTLVFQKRRYAQGLKLSHDANGKLWIYELTGAVHVPVFWNIKTRRLTPIEWSDFNMKIIAEENDSLWWFFNRRDRRPTLINMLSQTVVDTISNEGYLRFTDFCYINSNEIWFSSERGILKSSRSSKPLFHKLLNSDLYVSTQHSTRAIAELPNGDLFVSAYGGAKVMNAETGKATKIRLLHDGTLKSLPAMKSFFIDLSEGKIWMRSTDKVLSYVELKDGTIRDKSKWVIPRGKGRGAVNFGGRFVYCKNYDALSSLTSAAYSPIQLKNDERANGIKKGIQLKNDSFYLIYENGVVVSGIHEQSIDLSSIKPLDYTKNGLRIFDLVEDEHGVVWIGTERGLYAHDIINNELKRYTKADGLSDDRVAGISFDKKDQMWLSTFNGLTRFNPKTKQCWTYFEEDGIADNEFNHSSRFSLSDGRLVLGSINGLTLFNPDEISLRENFHAPFVLTSYGTYTTGDADLIQYTEKLEQLSSVKLGALNKYFRFDFALLDYNKTHLHKYRWYLDGFEQDWQKESHTAYMQYNNIPHGKYTFHAQAANANGIWNPNLISIDVFIAQVFYKQWWFICLTLLAFLGILSFIFKYRMNRALELERLRIKIASDLHDEVGSRMTRISIVSEMLKSGVYNDDEQEEALEKISSQSRMVTSTMSDVIWSIDGRKDHLLDLLDRMRDHCEELLIPSNIDYIFTSPWTDEKTQDQFEKMKLDFVLRQNIYFIFKEAINNIVKHANADQVVISLTNNNEQFTMTIADNGSTLKNNKKLGQGLDNMRMRANRINGNVTISKENGYTVKLIAPGI